MSLCLVVSNLPPSSATEYLDKPATERCPRCEQGGLEKWVSGVYFCRPCLQQWTSRDLYEAWDAENSEHYGAADAFYEDSHRRGVPGGGGSSGSSRSKVVPFKRGDLVLCNDWAEDEEPATRSERMRSVRSGEVNFRPSLVVQTHLNTLGRGKSEWVRKTLGKIILESFSKLLDTNSSPVLHYDLSTTVSSRRVGV